MMAMDNVLSASDLEVDTMNKHTAIYVRRSVSDKDKGNNSLSIDSQIADCIKSLREGEEYQVYCDDGKSAKDIEHRPQFLHMMDNARDGIISRIVVKKYDRFNRSTRDFLNIANELEGYGVTIYSLTEPFNTETEAGRMMRTNLLSFAEYEREIIAARVADAYSTRALTTGFYQGGKVYYGFTSERRTINGLTGSVLVPSDRANVIKIAYDLYKSPSTSLANIIEYFKANNIDTSVPRKGMKNNADKSNMDRSHLSQLLESPLYVRADKEVYQFLVSNGYEIVDDVEAFDGVHGLFRHKKPNGTGFYVKVGYHEGLVDAETWLAVQDKKSHNSKIPRNGTAKNSWLTGLTKCGHCGYALSLSYGWNASNTVQWRYYLDSGEYRANGCVKKRLKTRPDEVEAEVFEAMKKRLDELVIAKNERAKPDTEAERIKASIIRIDNEIRGFMDKFAHADEVLQGYISDRVKALHSEKADLDNKLRAKARKQKAVDTKPLSDPMSKWELLNMDEKHALAMTMLKVVHVSDEKGISIEFSL